MEVKKKFKKLCLTHMFYYSGNKCPFCEQERISHMHKRFDKKQEKKVSKNKEVTQSDLEKLCQKFNRK